MSPATRPPRLTPGDRARAYLVGGRSADGVVIAIRHGRPVLRVRREDGVEEYELDAQAGDRWERLPLRGRR